MPVLPLRRVLIVVENLALPPDRRVWQEATTLARAGYQVSAICPKSNVFPLEYELMDDVHIYRHPELPEAHSGPVAYAREYLLALWYWHKLARRVWRERGFDVIQGCNPPDLIFILALWYRLWGVRYIFDHHDVSPELYEAKFGKRGPLHLILRVLERLTFASASVSMATNESFRAIAQTRGRMAPEDVFVVRSAPRTGAFLPGPGDPAYRKGAKTVMGYIGVIGQQEGMDLLAIAAQHLIEDLGHRDVHFVIVGFGPHLPDVRLDIENRGLGAYFTFTGALYGEDMLRALNAIDIGVAPDPRNPMNDISTMNKVMEYMTLGKPLVQFDLTEGRASACDAALYAAANDPQDFAARLADLIEDPDRARKMGEYGRKRVLEQLSWDHSVPHLLAAYDRAFAKLPRQ